MLYTISRLQVMEMTAIKAIQSASGESIGSPAGDLAGHVLFFAVQRSLIRCLGWFSFSGWGDALMRLEPWGHGSSLETRRSRRSL